MITNIWPSNHFQHVREYTVKTWKLKCLINTYNAHFLSDLNFNPNVLLEVGQVNIHSFQSVVQAGA